MPFTGVKVSNPARTSELNKTNRSRPAAFVLIESSIATPEEI